MLAFALGLLISAAHAADHTVQVGPDLAFHPNTVSATPGDTVTFQFQNGPNSASEATARLNDPCSTEGGFDSGIQEAGGSSTIDITTTNSIYVFSSPHCAQGMVMIVNPGPNDSVATYMQRAEGASYPCVSPFARARAGSGGGSSPAPGPAPAPAPVSSTSTSSSSSVVPPSSSVTPSSSALPSSSSVISSSATSSPASSSASSTSSASSASMAPSSSTTMVPNSGASLASRFGLWPLGAAIVGFIAIH